MKAIGVEKDNIRKKLSHEALVFLANAVGCHHLRNGMCQGFSMMLLQALLAGGEKLFFARLKLIESYILSVDGLSAAASALISDIKAAEKKMTAKDPLTQKEEELIQIPIFFEGIALYHNPEQYDYLFEGNIEQEDFTFLYDFLKPVKSELNTLFTLLKKPYFFNRETLKNYLNHLETIFKKTSPRLPVLIQDNQHTLLLTYDNDHWLYVDINDLKRYPHNSVYSRRLNTSQVAESLFVSFGAILSDTLPFYTVICAMKNQEAGVLAGSFAELEVLYPMTQEQACMEDENGLSLLHLACQMGDFRTLQQILKQSGVNVNQALSPKGITPLGFVCFKGWLTLTEELVKHPEIDVNWGSNKDSPLWLACSRKQLAIINLLLKQPGLRINDLNERGETLLYHACAEGEVEVVKALLKHPDLDINQLREGSLSALGVACQNGHLEIVRLLLEDPRIDINQINRYGTSLFWTLCAGSSAEVIQELLKRPGLRIDLAPEEGYTGFYKACEENNVGVVNILLEHPGVDVNQRKKGNKSPLAIACQRGHLFIVEALLKHPNLQLNETTSNGSTAFELACQSGETAIVKKLFETGKINLEHVDLNGNTALHMACSGARASEAETLFDYLLENKASLSHENAQGQTPFDVAIEEQNLVAISAISKFIVTQTPDLGLFLSSESCEKLMEKERGLPATLRGLKRVSFTQTSHDPNTNLSSISYFFSASKENVQDSGQDTVASIVKKR